MNEYKNLDFTTIDGEFWEPLVGYEGVYSVSSLGRVRGEKRYCKHGDGTIKVVQPKIIKQHINKSGYLIVTISKNNKLKTFTVHRLVCLLFHDNPENKKFVNHKFGDKLDNRASQIEWATPSENTCHAYKIGLQKKPTHMKGRSGELAINNKPVIRISNNGDRQVFISLQQAQDKTSANKSNICNAIRKGLKAYGYNWEYAAKKQL